MTTFGKLEFRLRAVFCLLAAGGLVLAHSAGAATWYRGNTHAHSFWSDGDEFPEMVADWYKTNQYQFLVLSDHNLLSRGEKWRDLTEKAREAGAVEKCNRRFGEGHVIMRGEGRKTMVKLLPLAEVRKLLEEPGRFILIEGTEITNKEDYRPAHVNAVNVGEALQPQEGAGLAERLARDAASVRRYGAKSGRPAFSHLNHPNWKYSNTAEEMAAAGEADAFEVVNAGGGSNLAGDSTHPGAERLWDIANALRMLRDKSRPLYGCASDDAHHYHIFDEAHANPGRAWIMVRADALTADAITASMSRGDFYASTGVTLSDVAFDEKTRTLTVAVRAEAGHRYRIEFVGTPAEVDLSAGAVPPMVDEKQRKWPVTGSYSAAIGRTFDTANGTSAAYKLTGKELYVRAVVRDLTTPKKTWKNDIVQSCAWTQPVGWRRP